MASVATEYIGSIFNGAIVRVSAQVQLGSDLETSRTAVERQANENSGVSPRRLHADGCLYV
mgnify:CR=1 FL=1